MGPSKTFDKVITSRKEREYPKIGERAYAHSPISCPELAEGSGLFQPFRDPLKVIKKTKRNRYGRFRYLLT
jgi:hypothetical protein